VEVIVCWLVYSVKTSGEKYVGFKSTEMLVECIVWLGRENAIGEISAGITRIYEFMANQIFVAGINS